MSDYRENLFKGASARILGAGRTFRKEPTEAEKIMWECLRNRKLGGFKIRRQHALGSYIADFYCHEAKVVIEIDGLVHDNDEQKKYDDNRTKDLAIMGIQVVRFTNDQVQINLIEVLKTIENKLIQLTNK